MNWWQITLVAAGSYLVIGIIVQPCIKWAFERLRPSIDREQAANKALRALIQKYHNHARVHGAVMRLECKAEIDESLGLVFLNTKALSESFKDFSKVPLLGRMFAWPLIAPLPVLFWALTKRDIRRFEKELIKLKEVLAATEASFESPE